MQYDKKAKDIMADIFEFPHVPYWFSINQAIRIVRVSFLSTRKYPDPIVMLVFDEKYNLLGTLTLKDILRGIEPIMAQVSEEGEAGAVVKWDTLFGRESTKLSEKPVRDIMVPTKFFVEPDDPIAKAAYMMLRHDLILLPVLENKKKFVGLVRMREIFDEISNTILKE